MVLYIKEFFETLLGVVLPQWFYNTIGLLICINVVRGMLNLCFPKLTKQTDFILMYSILAYVAYEVLPVWGIAIQGG